MGYTHYWRRVKEFDADTFKKVVDDCIIVIEKVECIGIPIAGSHGEGRG